MEIEAIEALYDNNRHLQKLRERMRACGATSFVGAGLSMNVNNYPGWEGFLKRIASDWGVKKTVDDLLKLHQYEEAAQTLIDARSELLLHMAIDDIFGDTKLADMRFPLVLRRLPTVFDGLVITTNYDRVLEHVYQSACCGFGSDVYPGPYLDAMHGAIGAGGQALMKIHGDCRDRLHRILSRAEYDASYGGVPDAPDLEKPLPKMLADVFRMERPVVFLGCSLEGDRTMSVLRSIATSIEGRFHYAILPLPLNLNDRHSRERDLAACRIIPIWYPADNHDSILTILNSLPESRRVPKADRSIHLFTYSKKGVSEPADYELDLLTAFGGSDTEDGRSCTLDPMAWNQELMPRLRTLEGDLAKIRRPATILVTGNACNSAWISVGFVLRDSKNYNLITKRGDDLWPSSDQPSEVRMQLYTPTESHDPPAFERLDGDPEIAAINIAITHKTAASVRCDVVSRPQGLVLSSTWRHRQGSVRKSSRALVTLLQSRSRQKTT